MTDRAAAAELLRTLHTPGDPLVLVNVWDVASARTVAAADGCRAIATASWSIAAAHGYRDGEQIPLELMLAAIERIARAVELPVTADLESGYGDDADTVGETVARAIDAGAVGANLEDALRPIDEHCARIEAARRAGERAGVPFVINARSDEFIRREGDIDAAIERGRAYFDAGADCFFVPALYDLDAIRRLVAELGRPVSVLVTPASPSLDELAAAGVARVSVGPGSIGIAYAALARAARDLLARGAYPSDLSVRPPV